MNRYRKGLLWSVGLILAVSVVVPFSYSEAQSADIPLPASVCAEIAALPMSDMSRSERKHAVQCDVFEAADAWEQQYGQLGHQGLIGGVVYE